MIDVSHTEIPKRLDRIVKILADEQSNIEKDINRKTTRATFSFKPGPSPPPHTPPHSVHGVFPEE